MIIEATENQVIDAAKRAIAASSPVGLGWLHKCPENDRPDEAEVREYLCHGGIAIDYFRGRMVKLHLRRIDDTHWEAHEPLKPSYQSWCVRYPTWHDLFTIAGEP